MSHRLPATVVPSRYEIRLEPDLEAATFAGEETITVQVLEPVREIQLNAADLTIETVSIADEAGEMVHGEATLDEADERARLAFPRALAPGRWQLTLRFAGTLNDRLHGFYRSQYKDADGRTHVLAATQFEAVDARRAFPCWDEPAAKAVFALTVVVPEGHAAISNTRVVEERPAGQHKRVVRFADTISMSTYLVAVIVGELEATEPVLVGRTPLRVWSVPGKRHLASFARDAGAFCLGFFETYYDIPYPGDKVDLLAIPDFASGAMENLGAITFRETALLVDEATATHNDRERVADVVAHELAHMWFGDLVTMAWWNGIWLNEAFATFMEMLAVHAWKPEWDRWTSFGVSRAAALGVDGLHASRPIEFEVRAPRDCEAMFDLLTYEKGASVLRMLEQYLGEDVFQDGVRRYLRRHAYANAETTDLWKALGEAAGQPIPDVMDEWVFRPGYPLVTAELDGRQLHLTQRRFTYVAGEGDAAARWQVPITLRAAVGGEVVDRRILLDQETETLDLGAPPDWVVVNAAGHGFYRVRYAPELLRRLTAALPALLPIERFGLASDLFALAQAGLIPATEHLEATAGFRAETDRNVWTALIGGFSFVNRTLDDPARPGLAALVRDCVGPAAARLGVVPRPDEDPLVRQVRADLLRALGVLGDDPATQSWAREAWARYQADESAVDPSVLPAVIAVVARAGGEPEYEAFRARFERARSPQEEQRYLFALAGFHAPELVARTLAHCLDGSVRSQDAPYLVRALMATVHGRGAAWSFARTRWQDLQRAYPPSAFRRMWEGVTTLIRPDWEREVHAFFTETKLALGGKTLEQYLEQLRVAVAFREREAAALGRYLAAR
jgi:puromycin-sensitive aminopeptidase